MDSIAAPIPAEEEAPAPGRSLPVAMLALAAAPLVMGATLLQPEMRQSWPSSLYLPIHTLIEVVVTVTALATFAVQWYAAGARLNDARGRFIGSAFLGIGLLEMAHLLAFPGMPGLLWLPSSTERGIVYWLAARLWTVAAILGAAAVRRDSRALLLRRGPLVAGTVATVAAVLVADRLWIARTTLFFIEGSGLTPLKTSFEMAVAGIAAIGVVLYARRYRARADAAAGDLAVALALTVLSELCFTAYAKAFDSFNLLGHVYLLLAFYGVFHALFVEAVLRPYERLDATTRALTASNAELRDLQHHVEGELAVTIEELRSLQESREDLLRAVSHDLRTPLQVVQLQAERVARTAGQAEVARNAAVRISSAARHMTNIICDLVDSVRLERGTFALPLVPVSLPACVTSVLSMAALDPDRVRVEIPADLPPVLGDEAHLARVFQNIIGNAVKYSAPGTGILIAASTAGGQVVVSISDHGAGIAPEHLPHIFDRFYRCSGGTEGLGLGLYICKRIVEAHRGTLSCESQLGRGSTFTIELPLHGRVGP